MRGEQGSPTAHGTSHHHIAQKQATQISQIKYSTAHHTIDIIDRGRDRGREGAIGHSMFCLSDVTISYQYTIFYTNLPPPPMTPDLAILALAAKYAALISSLFLLTLSMTLAC